MIYSICLLLAMSQFRDQAFAVPDLPPAMTGFVDLTLALSAATVAVAALPRSNTASHGISPTVIAVGPPLVVALIVRLAVLLPNRSVIPRWNTCLAVSGAAAVLMIPLQALGNGRAWLTLFPLGANRALWPLWPDLVPGQWRFAAATCGAGLDHAQCAGGGVVAAVDLPVAGGDAHGLPTTGPTLAGARRGVGTRRRR